MAAINPFGTLVPGANRRTGRIHSEIRKVSVGMAAKDGLGVATIDPHLGEVTEYGRLCLPAKEVWVYAHRGFKSHPLRNCDVS